MYRVFRITEDKDQMRRELEGGHEGRKERERQKGKKAMERNERLGRWFSRRRALCLPHECKAVGSVSRAPQKASPGDPALGRGRLGNTKLGVFGYLVILKLGWAA